MDRDPDTRQHPRQLACHDELDMRWTVLGSSGEDPNPLALDPSSTDTAAAAWKPFSMSCHNQLLKDLRGRWKEVVLSGYVR